MLKTTFYLLGLLFFTLGRTQNLKVTYLYRYAPDSTYPKMLLNEMMVLCTDPTGSVFFSSDQANKDSILNAKAKKGSFQPLVGKATIKDKVQKKKGSANQIWLTNVGLNQYNVDDNVELVWTLSKGSKEMLGYDTRLATTQFRGRKWNAWFAGSIPISDGPYKFWGLPGLILEMSSADEMFGYTAVAIQKENTACPELDTHNMARIKLAQLKKALQQERENPGIEIIGKMVPQYSASGRFRSAQEVERDWIQARKKYLDENNNLLEPDLLKKYKKMRQNNNPIEFSEAPVYK